MIISKINHSYSLTFNRALNPAEMEEYKKVAKEAKEKIGQTGLSVLLMHDSCLPQSAKNNTGMSSLANKETQEFIQYMKDYLAINTIENLPPGEARTFYHHNQTTNPYKASAFSLNTHYIDLPALTQKEFGELLTEKDIEEVVKSNTDNPKTLANFKNVLLENGPYDLALKKAFINFSKLEENHPLKNSFDNFKKENMDWLFPKALFKALSKENQTHIYSKWNDLDKNLLDEKNSKNQQRIDEISKKYQQDSEFYYFKQFLAETFLAKAKKELNDKGLKFYSDFLVNFSHDEIWANKKAFDLNFFTANPRWRIQALDFKQINNTNSPMMKLLERKCELYAKRFDGMRIDVSWGYTAPKLCTKQEVKYCKTGSKIYEHLENVFKRIKKENYKPECIIHEVEANPTDFCLFTPNNEIIPALKNRVKIFTQENMSENWATYDDLTISKKLSPDEFLLTPANHDSTPIKNLALTDDLHKLTPTNELKNKKEKQVWALSNSFKRFFKDVEHPINSWD